MGFSLKKMTPHVEDDDLTGMFARALCDAQLVKYCYQAIGSLPPNLANPLASLLAQDTNIRWPEVTSTNTQLLVSLSQKILANDREWIIHHSRIVNLKDNVEAKDVIQTCNSYTALSLLLNRIVLDEKAFPSLDETLNGILRCAAWLVDNFITSLFLMFNITFMSTVGKALDTTVDHAYEVRVDNSGPLMRVVLKKPDSLNTFASFSEYMDNGGDDDDYDNFKKMLPMQAGLPVRTVILGESRTVDGRICETRQYNGGERVLLLQDDHLVDATEKSVKE